ncbi:hypothetical protein F5I97DRAFT_87944 [Phlebopus sp. FC_14]|nr:hypothetical protein F5I97DRAFT_87944 [Phlebopus sp. FC_14]
MHRALLVDEVLQAIFDNCLDDGKDLLCCIARCCKAWMDPALDRVWRRLPSAVPLLSLLPGYLVDHDAMRITADADTSLAIFRKYAARVRHVAHCHPVIADHSIVSGYPSCVLSNLETVRIERKAIGELPLRMSLSPRLRQLTLSVGYAACDSASAFTYDLLSRLKECPALERLVIRGYSRICLELPLRSLTTLQSLSLHLSSLTQRTFLAVSALPLLADLDVHASHMSSESLAVAVADHCGRNAPFFPSLTKLRIRAQPAALELILHHLPRHKLRALHVDAADPTPQSSWESVLQAIPMTTPLLRDFTLEHSIIDDSQVSQEYAPEKCFTLDQFRPLSKLPLCHFVLDSSVPPDLSDADIEEMAKWWPSLERLELGSPTALENIEVAWVPKTTLGSLVTLAKGCKKLGSLAIVLDTASTISPPSEQAPHPLATLLVSSRSEVDTTVLPDALCKLFPSLAQVTPGFIGHHEEAWEVVQHNLSKLHRGYSYLG